MQYCPGSGHKLLSASGVIEVCQDSRNFLCQCQVNDVVVRPSMIGNSGAFGCCLHISNMFFFSSWQRIRLSNVIPRATATGDFVDNIGL